MEDKINCIKCKHFYITWDKKFPRGCKAYNIKTKYTPSLVVYSSSGIRCMYYQLKKSE